MLDHVSITVSDIAAAERFYDAIMNVLDVVKVGRRPDWLGLRRTGAISTPGAGLHLDPQGFKTRRGLGVPLVLQGKVAHPGRCLLGCRHRRGRPR